MQEAACAIPCTLSDDCDTRAVALDYGVGQLSAAIHCPATERPRAPMSPRCDALRLAHCPSRQIRTIQGFLSNRGSVPVMIGEVQRKGDLMTRRHWVARNVRR